MGRKTALIILSLAILIPVGRSVAGLTETLPTYHWAYEYMEELRIRGFFSELNFSKKPFSRGEVAESLVGLLVAGWAMDDMPKAAWLLDELYDEFAAEMNLLRKGNAVDELSVGLLTQAGLVNDSSGTDDSESFRIKGGFQAGKHFGVYNAMNFDGDLPKDVTYMGREWRGLSAFTEQGYVSYETKRFSVLFGRDFRRWGIGRRGTLLISDYSRPLDQLAAELSVGPVELSFIASELDMIDGMRRYLSAHRIDMHLSNSLNVGVSELLIYGGVDASPIAAFTNPALVFHGENLNEESRANTLGSIDILWYPKRYWRLSGAILIDDIQLDNKELGDLEPNEIGFILGIQRANPLNMDGVDIWAEYVRITNRTYTTPNKEETLIHRNRAIGYFLGNDFDSWEFGASMWFVAGMKIVSSLTFIRDGAGGINELFTTPWFDKDSDGNDIYSIESGYSEPFPTGTVQGITSFEINAEKIISNRLRIRIDFENRRYDNFRNEEGSTESENRVFIGFWYDFVRTVGL